MTEELSIPSPHLRYVGRSLRRKEDPRLITGHGSYIEDCTLPGQLALRVVRSTEAHARLLHIETSQACIAEGVRLVLTGAEVNAGVGPLRVDWETPGLRSRWYACMADTIVRYVGQPIALIVADTAAFAEDAAHLITVQYEQFAPVIDTEKAFAPGAPLLYPEWGTNETCDPITLGQGDIEAAFAEADFVLQERFFIHRHTGTPLETRGCLASYDTARQIVTLQTSTQSPNQVRTAVARCLSLPEYAVHIIGPDVGGGFGIKDQTYPEEPLACYCAMRLKRPIKWIEDRSESFVASAHAREQVHFVQLACRSDGIILALKDMLLYDTGAHHASRGALPATLTASMLAGPYRLRAARITIHALVTNKTPSSSYRGFGMPQAVFVMESLMDMAAARLGIDPAEIRRMNLLLPEEVGKAPTATETLYDSGNFPALLERALHLIKYEEARREQAILRAQGRYRGIGIASVVECTALGPSQDAQVLGVLLPTYETVRVEMDQLGNVTVFCGAMAIGQGMETALSQIASDALGVAIENVHIVYGDTDICPPSPMASAASRVTSVVGAAIQLACEALHNKLKGIAAQKLEARPDDIDIRESQVTIHGVPDKTVPLQVIATDAHLGYFLPSGEKPGLSHLEVYDPRSMTYASATHICIVEVDIETGMVEVIKYAVCHDCGIIVNPALVEAQIHGGIAQGLGGAFSEHLVYDKSGQLLTTDFNTYLVPRAAALPMILIDHIETPAPHIPGGRKGAGEGGVIGAAGAFPNAVRDALMPLGIKVTQTPLTPSKVWSLLNPEP